MARHANYQEQRYQGKCAGANLIAGINEKNSVKLCEIFGGMWYGEWHMKLSLLVGLELFSLSDVFG